MDRFNFRLQRLDDTEVTSNPDVVIGRQEGSVPNGKIGANNRDC